MTEMLTHKLQPEMLQHELLTSASLTFAFSEMRIVLAFKKLCEEEKDKIILKLH